MKAIVQTKYGPFSELKIKEVPKPVPRPKEVLVKVHAASINAGNMFTVLGKPFVARFSSGLIKPNMLNPGSDVAGVVEAVGENAKEFSPGDEVFGDNLSGGSGTYAEYVCVPEDELALKPANTTFSEAAAVPQAATVALQALRDSGQLQEGQQVCITGASGGNGTFAVQIAKALGAKVTTVTSERNLEPMRSLGADHVIDYARTDFTHQGIQYDLILAMGGYRKLQDYARALRPGGTFVWVGGPLKGLFETLLTGSWIGRRGSRKMIALSHQSKKRDLVFVADLIRQEKVRPVIDSHFPLEETAEAFRHYQSGHMQGKVVVTMIGDVVS